MTSNEQIAGLMDAYLDQTATPAQREAFERLLASDPGVREEYELQLRIDARLKSLMQAPPAPAVPMHTEPARMPRRWNAGWMKIAAAVALIGVGGAIIATKPWNMLAPRPESTVATSVILDRLVGDGFVPQIVCDTDTKFAEYTHKKLGTSFLIKSPPEVQLVGWTYANGLLGDEAPILMAKHSGKPILVVMNRLAQDHVMRTNTVPGMHLHRREFDGLVFYEYSDSAEPVVISHLTRP